MLEITRLREEREAVIEGLAKRQLDAAPMIDAVISLDDERKRIQTDLDQLLAERNSLSKSIGNLFKEGKQPSA